MERLRSRARRLVQAFWFLPAVLVAAYILLAFAAVGFDRLTGPTGGVAFGGGPAAARSVLSTIAGSVITVAGLTFSIMIVTLQLVSAQYTPRALRTFLDDRLTQVVAGSFVGIFGYSLLVLRTVRGGDETTADVFVPSLAVSLAIGLGVIALAFLIAFVHHQSVSIQVSTIAARLAGETLRSVDLLYPAGRGEPRDEPAAFLDAWRSERRPGVLRPPRPGFVQRVDGGTLLHRAAELHLRIHVAVAPGRFVTEATGLVEVWPATAQDALAEVVRDSVELADERDLRVDAEFGVRQLADIALRAISPGVNDPTTATTCVGYLRAVLEALAVRDLDVESVLRADGSVVVCERPSFAQYLDAAFEELAVSAAGQPRVAIAIADTLAATADCARRARRLDHARDCERIAERIAASLLQASPSSYDRSRLTVAFAEVSARTAAEFAT